MKYKRAILDYSQVKSSAKDQGEQVCIYLTAYGGGAWFSPELGRYPSRQDLAEITLLTPIEIGRFI